MKPFQRPPKNPGEYYSNNIIGTYNVIKAGVEMSCKTIIFASSAAVYTPDNPYGLSKKIGEDLILNIGIKFKQLVYGSLIYTELDKIPSTRE